MTGFDENLKVLQNRLARAGYARTYKPFDTSVLVRDHAVVDIEIIARKDFYNVLYMEARANWRGISTDVAKKSPDPCLVITRYGDSHIILSTVKDRSGLHPKPRYLVIEADAKGKHTISTFINSIKVGPDDNIVTIDTRVQETFDRFATYGEALKEFGKNLGVIIEKTREMVENAATENKQYDERVQEILKVWREAINDKMDEKDIKDMLIQHILTYRIFAMVYDNHDFHNTNAVARALESLKSLLNISNGHVDYQTMELIAESITDSDQRQEFLKKIYETFYEKYDPAKADKDGIVYTPSEVVNFMVASTDQLLKKHFGKSLSDEGVTILDPATGTGTFIVHILRQISAEKIKTKFEKELYANEISVLPYYIAALNIEHAYRERTGEYKEFENICWMDTLDGGTKNYEKMTTYFKNDDNIKRISRQQKSKIHVIIGNPPYNAVQTSYSDVNPSDKYPHIDVMIKSDYSDRSKIINKHKSLDMYKRFLKWASNRITSKGMVVFVSNNSFLWAKADDGTRMALYDEFDYIYTANLKGNNQISGLWRKEGGKIFGNKAKVGIAITFFLKTGERCSKIKYTQVEDYMDQESKLKWLKDNTLSTTNLKEIIPTKDAVWLNQTNTNFDKLVPIVSKTLNETIFEKWTLGVSTNKDDWAYDFSKLNLEKKMKFYATVYNEMLTKYPLGTKNLASLVTKKIKWSDKTINELKLKRDLRYSNKEITCATYRPFVTKYLYYNTTVMERTRDFSDVFKKAKNLLITIPNPKPNAIFGSIATDMITDLGLLDGAQNIPIWKYDDQGRKTSNIKPYGLKLFQDHYHDQTITAEQIFYYTYAILNDPKYQAKYKFDLERDFPRIPLTKNFRKWSIIGKQLFDMHCNFIDVKKYDLMQINKPTKNNKVILQLKTEKKNKGVFIKIIIDNSTMLEGIPEEALEYVVGSKNPLKWILEFYKGPKNQISDKSSDDEEIRRRFNTYRFEDHKEDLITLLRRITTVCVETVRLRKELEKMEWGPQPKLEFTKIPKKVTITKPKKKKLKTIKKLKNVVECKAQKTLDDTR